MDSLKIDKSLITDLIECDDIYEGKIYFPAFRKKCTINIKNEVKQDYLNKVIDLILKLDRVEIKKACRVMLNAYNDYFRKYGFIDKIPIRLNVDNIMDYLGDMTVSISNTDDNILYYEVIFDDCEIEGDLWIYWAFVNNKLVYISGSEYEPGEEKEDWNYLIKYSKDIDLTEDEYLKLENDKKENDDKERKTVAGTDFFIVEEKIFSIPAFILGPMYLLLKGCLEIGVLFCVINLLVCYFFFPGGYIFIIVNHFVVALLFRYIYYFSLSLYSKRNADKDDNSLRDGYQKRIGYTALLVFVYLLAFLFLSIFCLANFK